MNYKEAKSLAELMDKSITCYDLIEDKHERIIAIQHFDGSYLEFHSACYRELEGDEWFVVFTEHHGFHVYPKGDVQWVKKWVANKENLYYNKDDA